MTEPLRRFPRMMQEYLVARLRELYVSNHQRVMELSTAESALAYCREMRRKVQGIFGPWPQKSPLNLRVSGERRHDLYLTRSVLFESRPGFVVTANIYLPHEKRNLRPVVLCLCGHHWQAKAYLPYQSFAQALARMGYVTLIFDPVGQGERIQFPDSQGESCFGPGETYPSVKEHNAMDCQLLLLGDWVGRWMVWDCMRALDVLLLQEQVDPTRVGVTGNSGGGTMTTYMLACDPRVTMAAPSCWLSSWYHNAINEEPLDAEQCPPGILSQGLEQSDLVLAAAPTPVLFITQEQDFFDQRGSLEAFARVQHVFRLLNARGNLDYHVGPGAHDFHLDGREAMYGFFNKHAGVTREAHEPALNLEKPEILRCTPGGQVSGIANSHLLPDIVRQQMQNLSNSIAGLSPLKLRERIGSLLSLAPRHAPPPYRILRPWTKRGYPRPHASHFLLETESRYNSQVIVTKLENERRSARPRQSSGTAVLYLPHKSCDVELREDAYLRELQLRESEFFACDYRGVGESQPDTCRPNFFPGLFGSDYHYASYALMLGQSYLAWRVHDVLSTIDWICMFGYSQIHLVARGYGSIPAALTAVIDRRVSQLTLSDPPTSFADWTDEKVPRLPLSALLPGVLQHFDLEEILQALGALIPVRVMPAPPMGQKPQECTAGY